MYTGEDERYVCVTICTDINIHSYINTHMHIHMCVCVLHECVYLVVETEVENILLLHWLSSSAKIYVSQSNHLDSLDTE